MSPKIIDLAAFVDAKAEWSRETFGPQTVAGLRKHIDKELAEIDRDPADLVEWVDLVLLALDGATKHAGATGAEFVAALVGKMETNRGRTWPDWRTLGPDEAREHVRHAPECDVSFAESCSREPGYSPIPPSVDYQPRPTTGDTEVWPLVLADIEARREFGLAKYGVPLRTHDGRKSLVDAYQEALDLVVYLRKEIEERKA